MFRWQRRPLTFDDARYCEVKDPCPVRAAGRWHLFGTGVTGPHRFEVLHAVADELAGPWSLLPPVDVDGLEGSCVGAPGAVCASSADGDEIHLFLQTDYNRFGGTIEHLVSRDAGVSFERRPTALQSVPGTAESGIYDAHPAAVDGECYLVYSAFDVIGEPEIHLARSDTDTWDGPWTRLGPALGHSQVAHHNQRGAPAYEWGLEGGQLLELPDGRVLLNAVCFLNDAPRGARQRVFLALADEPLGEYAVTPAAISPLGGPFAGENGHATLLLEGDTVALFFQERSGPDGLWSYALATAPLASGIHADDSSSSDQTKNEEAA